MADEGSIERMARMLCRDTGRDPDEMVDSAGPDASGQPQAAPVPAWTLYADKAKPYVSAAKALKLLE